MPNPGLQACGEEGIGRMQEPEELLEAIKSFFTPKILQGKKIMLTAGPTFEAIDPVRGITNRSSGQMGYALARVASRMGADVYLISGPCNMIQPKNISYTLVENARNMYDCVMDHLEQTPIDFFISVAAVSDYRPKETFLHKIKKSESEELILSLSQNPDILAEVSKKISAPFCVGFAAETNNIEEYAAQKRLKKNIPMLVANYIQDTLGYPENEVIIFDQYGTHIQPRAHKIDVAYKILKHMVNLHQRCNQNKT
jgi:phosphopantothenoylcysteine decarboxylase/phosphopantothenate--cysteine ligase